MEKRTKPKMPTAKKKLMLVLPLLTLPFMTLLFWALGGGGVPDKALAAPPRGININLPIPKLENDASLDKMTYYDRAAADSIKKGQFIAKDPATRENAGVAPFTAVMPKEGGLRGLGGAEENTTEQQLVQKLKSLEQVVSHSPGKMLRQNTGNGSPTANTEVAHPDIQKLEGMMAAMSQTPVADPEMEQINGMLEKILDIQHPGRVEEKLKAAASQRKESALKINRADNPMPITVLEAPNEPRSFLTPVSPHNGFYSLEEGTHSAADSQNAIQAVVHETQTIINGSVVKLRVVNPFQLADVMVPAGAFLFGIASLKGERLSIAIESIRLEERLFPIALSVFDLDGMEGLYIPGAISRDVGKASADRSMQTLGVTTLDDSWTSQAAGAGIEAAKSLFSKKVKLIKVVVKAGYKVLLKDDKPSKNN